MFTAIRARWRVAMLFLCGTASLWVSLSAHATCDHPVPPTASIVLGEVGDDGTVPLTVTYSFPEPTLTSKQLELFRDGQHLTFLGVDSSGSGTVPAADFMACDRGTHVWWVVAKASCVGSQSTTSNSVQWTFNSSAKINSITYEDHAGTGNGRILVDYEFHNVFSDSDQHLSFDINGQHAGFGPSSPRKNVWPLPLARGCWWNTFTMHASACGFESTSKTLTMSNKPTMDLSVAKLGKDPATGRRIIMAQTNYDVATPGAKVRVDLLKWIDAAGQVYPGGTLRQFTPALLKGKDAFTFVAPSNARQLMLRATVVNGCEPVADTAAIECAPCDNASANPVYYSDGNVKVDDADPLPPVAQWSLARSYDSDEQIGGLFGRGWTTLFDRRVIVDNDTVSVTTDSNEVVVFENVQGVFRQAWPSRESGTLTLNSGTYTYRAPASTMEADFRASDGRLVALRNRAGVGAAVITYDTQGRPSTFSDTVTGVTWELTLDTQRHVTSIAVTGHPDLTWTYTYDGTGNLTAVTAPGSATWRTYEYVSNLMTASRDTLGHLIESHTYDADGFGTSSTGDVDEIASLEYNIPGPIPDERITRITYKTGAQAEYTLRPIGGAMRPVRVTGGCSSCGVRDATFVRDENGRVVLHQKADGYITRTTYAGVHVLSEERPLKPVGCDPRTDAQRCRLTTDALAIAALESTSATELVTYEYGDANWPDRVTASSRASVLVTGELTRQERTYDPATGAVASSTTIGWTGATPASATRTTVTTFYANLATAPAFTPGGSFDSAWLSLAQPVGLPKSTNGPRAGDDDVVSFVYYPIDATVPALLRGHLAAVKNAAGHITHYDDYDVFGNVTSTTDPNGVTHVATYDNLGRVLTSTVEAVSGCNTSVDPLCATDLTTTRTYASTAGPLSVETRAGGGVTVYTYDDRGRVATISRGPSASDLRERIETTYDPLTGKKSLERTLAAAGASWVEKTRQSFAYDAQSRLQTVTHADNAAAHYTYDPEDRVATVRDENHATPNTTYAYDSAGRLATVTQKLASASGGAITTHYSYDHAGNLTSVTDPNGNVTTYVYDDFGQMLTQQSPVSGTTTYVYDVAGNLTQTTDANGATTTRTYDASNRVLTAVSVLGFETESVTWAYDSTTSGAYGLGRLATMEDPSGTTTYAYERRGLLRQEVHSITDPASVQTYGYDADGNRKTVGYPSGRVVTYAFDYAGRPTTASGTRSGQTTSYVTAAAYLPFGPPTSLTLGNGTVETRTYNSRYLPLTTSLTKGAVTLVQYTYTNDPVGNITAISDGTSAAYNRTFGYDDLNRLTTANTGSSLWGSGSFAYDRMGNVLSATLGVTSRTFSYQGTTPKINAATDLLSVMTYDDAGNELASPAGESTTGATAHYSSRNLIAGQLIPPHECAPENGKCGDLNSETWLYHTYDGRGVRVTSFETNGNINVELQPNFYFYTPELSMLNIVSRSTGRSADVIWFGSRPVADHDSSTARYTFADHLGTPILQTSAMGAEVWRAEYEPYGNVYMLRSGDAPDDQPLRFPGQQVAFSTAAGEENYNIFRWYRAGWGRYTQADPLLTNVLRGKLLATDVSDVYRYAALNPNRFVDPKGLKCASGQCADCPQKLWAVTVASASAFFFVGGEAGTMTAKCQSGMSCSFAYWCASGGIGGDLGVTASFGVIGGPDCKCAEDLAGWGGGVSGTVGEGILGSAGGLASGTKCGGYTFGAGLGIGASAKASGCKTYLIGCEKGPSWY